ncbi:MAG: manganese efflux pump [Bacteroidales bacterium]
MDITTLFILTGFCCGALAMSFSSLYFKSGFRLNVLKPSVIYFLLNLLLAITGLMLGKALTTPLDIFAPKAGALLLLVIACKIIIRAFKTKTIQRIYDISKTSTLFGLILMLNIDILLVGTALPLLASFSLICGMTPFAIAALLGLALGVAIGKNAGFIFSNILDLAAALSVMIISLVFLFG